VLKLHYSDEGYRIVPSVEANDYIYNAQMVLSEEHHRFVPKRRA
jgi:hypothetical protein